MRHSTIRDVLQALPAAFTLLVLSGTSEAQVFGSAESIPGAIDEAATISLDVVDRPIADVLKLIRDRSGANILLAPGVDVPVTIAFTGVPWQEALQLVAENAGCVVISTRGRVYKVEKPEKVTFSFEDEDIRKVIQAIATKGRANVIVSPEVKGVVTMEIHDRPWRVALDNVVKTLGYNVVEEEHDILRIVTSEALVEQLETRVIELRYLRPRPPYTAAIKTDFAVGKPKEPANDPNVDFPLLGALRKHLSKNGELDYFDKQNALFIKDTKPVLDRISDVITRLDVEPAEIFIDVKFVTTAEGNDIDLQFGFEELTITFNGAAIPSKVPFNMGSGGFDDSIYPDNPGAGPGGTDMEGPFGADTYVDDRLLRTGMLDFRNVRLAVRLNEIENNVEVVQAPKLITLDHEVATVFAGDIIRYAETEAATNQAGGLAFSVKEAQNSPVETGFQLLIIPHIVPGTDKILMTVIPQARFLSGTTDPNLAGFNLFGVEPATISLPQITSQTVVTNMMLASGETGVIGGLVTDRSSRIVHKVPWAGDLPFVGFFFRRTQDVQSHNNLLVFITPTIIRGSTQSQENLDRVLAEDYTRSTEEWEAIIKGLPLPESPEEMTEGAAEGAESEAEGAVEPEDAGEAEGGGP